MFLDDDQADDTYSLLAVLLDRLGGNVVVSRAELQAVKDKYGKPCPLLVARIEGEGETDALVAQISTLDTLVAEQAPIMARVMDVSLEQGNLAAEAIRDTFAAHRAAHELRSQLAEEAVRAARDGLN